MPSINRVGCSESIGSKVPAIVTSWPSRFDANCSAVDLKQLRSICSAAIANARTMAAAAMTPI
jgi:hypothetical protein